MGHYEYKVMSVGLAGESASFQGAMNATLAPVLRCCALVFFDDILVYNTNLEDHVKHLEEILSLLKKDQWQVKESKCLFAQHQPSYLGHSISAEGVATKEDKIESVRTRPTPATVKELGRFLGLVGYYRKFIRHFGIISRLLATLLRKGNLFVWTNDCQEAFQALKGALMAAPVLALQDFTKTFVVETECVPARHRCRAAARWSPHIALEQSFGGPI